MFKVGLIERKIKCLGVRVQFPTRNTITYRFCAGYPVLNEQTSRICRTSKNIASLPYNIFYFGAL